MAKGDPIRPGTGGPGWLSVVLISFLTSCFVCTGFYLMLGHDFRVKAPARPAEAAPAALVKVPPLTGLTRVIASELLASRGLRLVVEGEQPDESLPRDSVISQKPLADSVLPSHAAVSVLLSRGRTPEVMLPDLTGLSLDEARETLDSAQLVIGMVSGPDAGERLVRGTEPPPGRLLPRGSAVHLLLAAVGVPVPNLVGLSWTKTKALIDQSGLKLGKVRERYDNERDAFVVLEQAPAAGQTVPAGSAIDIVRNEGD